MARSTSSIEPVKTLRELATKLEASVLECLAKPGKRSVHKLRTSTRRIEAQLELLAMLPASPAQTRPRQKVLRLLKRIRKAAGVVRDIDVHQNLIEQAIPRNRGSQSTGAVRRDARQLRQDMERWRDKHADELVQLLKQEKTQLPLAFKDLFDSLGDCAPLAISETDLLSIVRTWYVQNTPAAAPDPDDIEHLHDIRKQAKLARYLAEAAPPSATRAHRLATKFENLQEAGGEWHDWLLLAEIARRKLGDSAGLPRRFAARATKSLKQFERRIEKMNGQTAHPEARAA